MEGEVGNRKQKREKKTTNEEKRERMSRRVSERACVRTNLRECKQNRKISLSDGERKNIEKEIVYREKVKFSEIL